MCLNGKVCANHLPYLPQPNRWSAITSLSKGHFFLLRSVLRRRRKRWRKLEFQRSSFSMNRMRVTLSDTRFRIKTWQKYVDFFRKIKVSDIFFLFWRPWSLPNDNIYRYILHWKSPLKKRNGAVITVKRSDFVKTRICHFRASRQCAIFTAPNMGYMQQLRNCKQP